jgi:hypothetical protein
MSSSNNGLPVRYARARSQKIKLTKPKTVPAIKDWRAAAFLLERMFPKEYGRTPSRVVGFAVWNLK